MNVTNPGNHEQELRLFGSSQTMRAALVSPLSATHWLPVLIVSAGIYFFHGFLVPVLEALVIVFVSWPLYRPLLTAVDRNMTIGATLALLFIVAFLVVSISFTATYAVNEIRDLVSWAVEINRHGPATPRWNTNLPVVGECLNEQWMRNVNHPGTIGELIQLVSGANIGSMYRGVLTFRGGAFGILLTLLFMQVALFFTYRGGESFVAQFERLGEWYPTDELGAYSAGRVENDQRHGHSH